MVRLWEKGKIPLCGVLASPNILKGICRKGRHVNVQGLFGLGPFTSMDRSRARLKSPQRTTWPCFNLDTFVHSFFRNDNRPKLGAYRFIRLYTVLLISQASIMYLLCGSVVRVKDLKATVFLFAISTPLDLVGAFAGIYVESFYATL